MTGLLIVVLLSVAVLAWAVHLGLHVDPENAPSGSPAWQGPDAAALDAALTDHVQGIGDDPAPTRTAELDELAAHHAFDMATRNFDSETTPEGETLEARRTRLHPKLVGEIAQWQAVGDVDAAVADATRVLDGVLGAGAGDLLRASLDGPEVGEIGIGAAVERGRVGLCVVMMSRWATLDDTAPPPAHDGWTFRGELGRWTAAADLQARFRVADRPWSDAVTAEPEDQGATAPGDPDRFRVTVPVAPDATAVEVQFLRKGVHGRVRGA